MISNKKALFVFRRDLRVQDNIGLTEALKKSKYVIPVFIFDPRQVGKDNSYRSNNAIQFMLACIENLNKQLKKYDAQLYLFYGKAENVIQKLIKEKICDAVYCNRDYTPFSLQRDQAIEKICIKQNCSFEQFNDALLHEPEEVTTNLEKPYLVFTPFFRKSSKLPIKSPIKISNYKNWFKGSIARTVTLQEISKKVVPQKNLNIHIAGGTQNALKIIKNINQFKDYKNTRNYPALPTTNLSAHLKFGTISIRSVYYAIKNTLGKNHVLIQQLFWRDFFTHVAYCFSFVFGQAFKTKYNNLRWSNNKKNFERWCLGTTGFPIVDAGMRQLNITGFMHNRVRMIVGSFLVKDLHIDWRSGERYFAQKLVDYDPCVNNGNWQWVASTGCDAQPYFRIFNPWLQQKKYDSQCEYIKKWVPELKNIDPRILHRWYSMHNKIEHTYYAPIVNHQKESSRTKQLYKKIS